MKKIKMSTEEANVYYAIWNALEVFVESISGLPPEYGFDNMDEDVLIVYEEDDDDDDDEDDELHPFNPPAIDTKM